MTNERKDTISQLLGKWGAGLFRTIILGALGILLWQGKNMVNSAISQNPDVMEAKSSAASATSGLKELSAKVDTIISTEDKIVEGFKISHQDQEKTNNEMATLTERVAGQQGQLNRIEAKSGF